MQARKSQESEGNKICVVSFPLPSKRVVDIYVSRIVSLLQPISEKLYVITGKDQIQNSCNENTEFLDTGMVMRFRKIIN